MADRKHTPDIMSELMAGQPEAKASKPARQRTSKPARKSRVLSSPQASSPESKAIKATFYISSEAIDALEQLWMERRQKAEPHERGRISKSGLIEEAILLLRK